MSGGSDRRHFRLYQYPLGSINPAVQMSLEETQVLKASASKAWLSPVSSEACEPRPTAAKLGLGGEAKGLGIRTFYNSFKLW